MNEKIQKCQTCYYDNRCYWQELADHIPMDCNDYKRGIGNEQNERQKVSSRCC